MRRILFSFAMLFVLTDAATAQCSGTNLIDALPQQDQAALRAEAALSPHATGNFWRAARGTQVVHLIGTYHFDDPRHAATMAALAPVLSDVTTLLVEAGPEEEAALKARITREPQLMIIDKGPTLPEMLPRTDWLRLSQAMRDRGIAPFMAAKFRPWYVTMLLGVPPCDIERMATTKGLDGMLIDAALAEGVTVSAMEPYDTLFGIFDQLPQEDQLAMITSALAMEERSEDFSVTLADSYFAEEGRLIWEFMRHESLSLPNYTPERVAEEFATMEEALMTSRNRKWIPEIEAAAARGAVLVAFGALHLAGEHGVLSLLEAQGFTVERLAIQ